MKPDESKADEPLVSTGNSPQDFHPEIGMIDTSLQTLGQVGGKFQHQFLENADELLHYLKQHHSPEDYERLAGAFEYLIKQPLRRALGRIRCVQRSLEELKTSLRRASTNHTPET